MLEHRIKLKQIYLELLSFSSIIKEVSHIDDSDIIDIENNILGCTFIAHNLLLPEGEINKELASLVNVDIFIKDMETYFEYLKNITRGVAI